MIQELTYNGHSAAPSDHQSPDGDLTLSMNAIRENGSIHAVRSPRTVLTLKTGQKVIYIHSVSVFENYIILDETSQKLLWIPSDDTDKAPAEIMSLLGVELYEVTGIGNTLVILTSKGVKYALYSSGKYRLMQSNKPVFPSISFRLYTYSEHSGTLTAHFPPYISAAPGSPFFLLSEEAVKALKDVTLAYINPFFNQAKTNGEFQYPFMIRYAYRMYDDTLSFISPPVLMHPCVSVPYTIRYAGQNTSNGSYTAFHAVVKAVYSHLKYQITNVEEVNQSLSEWKDLVKSIDFFITPPLNIIDEESMFKGAGMGSPLSTLNNLMMEGCYNNERTADGTFIHRFHKDSPGKELFFSVSSKTVYDPEGPLTFRLISSLKVSSLSGEEDDLAIEKDVLSSLDGREELKGDSDISETLIARHAFVYNSRLNLTGVSVTPNAYPLEACLQYANAETDPQTGAPLTAAHTYKAYIFIEAEKKNVMVQSLPGISMNVSRYTTFFFYPNVHAKELIVERTAPDGTKTYSKTAFQKHHGLNGCFTYINSAFSDTVDMSTLSHTDIGIPYPNKIYTSEANDPFTFPANLVNAVGSGIIIGISAAAKALSEGQFGQFPLYAFTDEGVWALEVSSTGSYYARQPITRDVCLSCESITQIDNAVLFATQRGIMLLAGSTSTCISDAVDSSEAFSLTRFPTGEALLKLSFPHAADIRLLPFRQFIAHARMLYDYAHQRIILYNPGQTYAYLFSLESKQWGMMESRIASGVNSYPEALAMSHDNRLINFSTEDTAQPVTSLLLTRPFKLADPNLFKTVTAVIQRGYLPDAVIQQALYASNDYRHWFPVRSSTNRYLRGFSGTPFKAFRLAVITQLSEHESLSGCSIEFIPRLANRLR